MELTIVLATTALLALVLVLGAVIVARWYHRVPASSALIVTSRQGMRVLRRGGLVLPVIHTAEVLDLGVRTIDVSRCGKQGIVCWDNIRVDVTARFTVGIRDTEEDITKLAQTIGVARANDPAVVRELLASRLEDALREAFREQHYESAVSLRPLIRDHVLHALSGTLDGFEVRDVALGALEATPIEQLDNTNILDALGIKKITEIACAANIITNELQHKLAVMVIKSRMEAEQRAYEEKAAAVQP